MLLHTHTYFFFPSDDTQSSSGSIPAWPSTNSNNNRIFPLFLIYFRHYFIYFYLSLVLFFVCSFERFNVSIVDHANFLCVSLAIKLFAMTECFVLFSLSLCCYPLCTPSLDLYLLHSF